MSFSDLPEEMKLHIFTYLPWRDILSSLSRINKTCRYLGFRAVRSLDFASLNDPFPAAAAREDNLRRTITLFSPGLRSVTFECLHADYASLAVHAVRNCPNLTSLPIVSFGGSSPSSTSSSSDTFIRAAEEHGRSLRSVRLIRLDFSLSTHSFVGLRNLTDLTFFHTHGLNDGVMVEVGKHCRRLESFAFSYNWSQFDVTDLGMSSLLEGVKGTIRRLQFNGEGMTNTSFRGLGRCHQLQSLKIHGAKGLKVEGLSSIVRLPRLTHLYIVGGNNSLSSKSLNDGDFREAFSRRTTTNTLKELTMYGVDRLGRAGIVTLAESCQELRRLDLFPQDIRLSVSDEEARDIFRVRSGGVWTTSHRYHWANEAATFSGFLICRT